MKILFVMFTRLEVGLGTETTVLHYTEGMLRHGHEVSIMETDFGVGNRMPEEKLKGLKASARVVRIKSISEKIRHWSTNNYFKFLFNYGLRPILMEITRARYKGGI